MAVLDDEIDVKKEQIDVEKYSNTSKVFQAELGTKLDKLVGSWTDPDLEKIVAYLKEWNTNAKHSFVSQALLNRFVTRLDTKCYFLCLCFSKKKCENLFILWYSPFLYLFVDALVSCVIIFMILTCSLQHNHDFRLSSSSSGI